MLLRVHGMARLPAAGSRPRDAEWAYGDSGVRTGVRNWPGAAFTFLEFCLQVVLPVLLRANGRATTRWLDIVNTDIDYRNFCFNYNMDHNANDSQGDRCSRRSSTSISVGVGSVEYMVQVKFRIPLVAIPSSAFVAIRSSQTTLCSTRSVHASIFHDRLLCFNSVATLPSFRSYGPCPYALFQCANESIGRP